MSTNEHTGKISGSGKYPVQAARCFSPPSSEGFSEAYIARIDVMKEPDQQAGRGSAYPGLERLTRSRRGELPRGNRFH